MPTQRPGAPLSVEVSAQDPWADLADLVLMIAREIQLRPYVDENALKLSLSEGMVIRYLSTTRDATPSRIADSIGLRRNNLSVVLRGLERKGVVERRTNPADRREVAVQLTDRGVTQYELVRREWSAAVRAAIGDQALDLGGTLAQLAVIQTGLVQIRPPAGPATDDLS